MTIDLNKAVRENNTAKVREYIREEKKEKGQDWADKKIQEACRDAISLGHKKVVKAFLDEGLSKNQKFLATLEYHAADVGNLAIFKLLHKKMSQNFDNDSALLVAVRKNHLSIAKYLLKNGQNPNGEFMVQTFLGWSAFKGDKKMADLLIQYGADVKKAILSNRSYIDFLNGHFEKDKCEYFADKGVSPLEMRSKESLKEWDEVNGNLSKKFAALHKDYKHSVKFLLDRALGIDFDNPKYFLKGHNISKFNFVGVSVKGQPVTQKLLRRIKGAKKAFYTLTDIERQKDSKRRKKLMARLEVKYREQGKMVSEKGVVNLVPLPVAARRGLIDVVEARLSGDVDPSTAIELAAEKGFVEIVKILAKHPKMDPKKRKSAAKILKKKGHLEVAKYIESIFDPNEKDKDGYTPLHKAILRKNIKEIKMLLESGADSNIEDENGRSPLIHAVIDWNECMDMGTKFVESTERDTEIVQILLDNGADPNQYHRFSPLSLAAMTGNLEAMKLLLPVTEKKDIQNRWVEEGVVIPWYAPLMFYSLDSKNWIQILKLLQEHGADFNQTNPESGLIFDLRETGDETLLYRFVRDLPSIDNFKKGDSDLMEIVRAKYNKILEKLDFLLKNKANPAIQCGRDAMTPLHLFMKQVDFGCFEGLTESVIDRFLENGVEVNTRDGKGRTPLHIAAEAGHLKAVAYLIDNGADIHARCNKGCIPLHYAAAGHPVVTQFLIDSGSDVNALNQDEQTPIAYSIAISSSLPYQQAQMKLITTGRKVEVYSLATT